MPKLNRIPSLRKHRGRGRAVVTIAGKDYYLRPHGSQATMIACDRKIAEWLACGRSPAFGQAQELVTVAQLLTSYREPAEQYDGTDTNST